MRRRLTHGRDLRLVHDRPAAHDRKPNLRRKLLEGGMLWVAWLRAPRQVGAVVPSGSRLAVAMAAEVPEGEGLVVELGGGTGSITAGLLCTGIRADALVVVERDPQLARCLRRRFPDCRVLCGDACRLPQLLVSHGIHGPVKAVVSSLPLLSMSWAERARLMRGVRKLLCSQGTMVQYTYGMRCPVPDRTLVRDNVRARRIARIWRNVPPASVWRFESNEPAKAFAEPLLKAASEP
jgi:phosphatidylethanolamine/phosphatidyl-N-methylethanolamine N-methyltransferase